MSEYEKVYQVCKKVSPENFLVYVKEIESLIKGLPEFSRLEGMLKKYQTSKEEKDWASFVMFFEHKLSVSLKDEDFLNIESRDQLSSEVKLPYVFVLDNLRSAWNVGNILRSAEAFGVSEVILSGYTPDLSHEKVLKASMGVEKRLRVSSMSDLDLQSWKQQGYTIYGLETHKEAVSLDTCSIEEKAIFILGNERFGLSKKAIAEVDHFIKIPMIGGKQSLNVGNAMAIASYEYIRKYGKLST